MVRKRTTVFADEDDLEAIKVAAARHGTTEAEIIRHAIHLAALAHRDWSAPFFSETFSSAERGSTESLPDVVWAEEAVSYERTKRRPADTSTR